MGSLVVYAAPCENTLDHPGDAAANQPTSQPAHTVSIATGSNPQWPIHVWDQFENFKDLKKKKKKMRLKYLKEPKQQFRQEA